MNPDEAQQPGFEAMEEAMNLSDSDSSHNGTYMLSLTQLHIHTEQMSQQTLILHV